MRIVDSTVTPAMCGETITLGSAKSGFSAGLGSRSKTSSPAPRSFPPTSASCSAASSTTDSAGVVHACECSSYYHGWNVRCWYENKTCNVVYAGGSAPNSGSNGEGNTIIASTNAGSTWTDISNNSCNTCNSGVHVDAHAIAFAPAGASGAATKVYVGTDGGAWNNSTPESPTSSQAWNNLNPTLALTQFYAGLSNNPAGWQFRTFGGAQDNGMQVFGQQSVTSLPLSWDDTLACGDGGVDDRSGLRDLLRLDRHRVARAPGYRRPPRRGRSEDACSPSASPAHCAGYDGAWRESRMLVGDMPLIIVDAR